ncbi:MarR family winged helix-turn-helix transcriptional regulator [Phycicoccus avicenniae]|uniref:MarR family winged helix-turn-helix transcriptional regulator n=1 Tax=Phycicoccus avicenniae TaxID=2828860 RepID=UPI003D2B42D8
MDVPTADGPGRRSPTWMRRRGIPTSEASEHTPWVRLHDHLALRHGIRADQPRRWERPVPDDHLNLPVLLRQAGAQVDRGLVQAISGLAPGITPTGLDALRRLRDKPSSGVNLAEYLALPERRVSRLLAGLEAAGLVSREPGWRELRTHRTELTPRGRELLDGVEECLESLSAEWFEGLEPIEVRALLRLLHALADRPLPRRPLRAARPSPPEQQVS